MATPCEAGNRAERFLAASPVRAIRGGGVSSIGACRDGRRRRQVLLAAAAAGYERRPISRHAEPAVRRAHHRAGGAARRVEGRATIAGLKARRYERGPDRGPEGPPLRYAGPIAGLKARRHERGPNAGLKARRYGAGSPEARSCACTAAPRMPASGLRITFTGTFSSSSRIGSLATKASMNPPAWMAGRIFGAMPPPT